MEKGNVVDGLKYPDATFNVIFCNQVLLHIPEVVATLCEMKRVLRLGEFLAARESDTPFRRYPYLLRVQLLDKYLYNITITQSDRTHLIKTPQGRH
jgi:ubiquinone/menaquinone biosynthesis C-methylase UbiE